MTRQALTTFGRSGVVATTFVAWLCIAHPAFARADALWGELPLPGGANAARDALVLGDSQDRLDATLLVDFVRRYANTDLRAAADRFERHVASSSREVTSWLPLPLPRFWQAMFGADHAAQLRGLLRSRSALLVYHGLMALDPGTLGSLSTRQVLLRDLANNEAASAAFAAFAAGLRVDDERVLTPGDADDHRTWQTLTGAPPTAPDPFIRALFTRDNGRLAWFYDTVAALPRDARKFVLMSHLPPAERAPAVAAVYARFAGVEPGWRIETRPFHRPAFDGALALLTLEPREDGTVGPAWWPAVLERVTGQADWSHPLPAGPAQSDRPADARWVFDWLFGSPDDARQRFAMLRFAERRLADVARADAPQMAAVLGGVRDLATLMFTLERLGVRDPALLADVARTARRVTHGGGEARVRPLLGRWQMALGLLEQVQRRVHLPANLVDELVRAWMDIAPSNPDTSTGTTAAWIANHLLPALARGDLSGESVEDTFLRAATTSIQNRRVVFAWEGLDYAIDEGGAAYRAAATIRRARSGPRLDHVLELHDVFTTAKAASSTARRALGPRIQQLATVVEQIDRPGDRRIRDFVRAAERAGAGTGRAAEQTSAIGGALDVMTETVVASLLYALAVAPTVEPVLYPDAWSRHDLEQPRGLPGAATRAWRDVAWQFPVDYGLGGGTRLIGAYLGVDIALADSQLARVASETLPVPGAVDDPTRRGLVEQLVLTDEPTATRLPETVAADIAAARQMVESWIASPPADEDLRDALRRARLDGWRINTIIWNVDRNRREVLRLLAVGELAALGMSRDGRDVPAMPWAGSGRFVDGCHCQNVTRAVTADVLRGRRLGIQAFRINDAAVRLAELLRTLELDVRLVPALLPMAIQDWLDHSRPAWLDDWDAYAAWPRSLEVERVESYLLHLVSSGVFSPPSPEESR